MADQSLAEQLRELAQDLPVLDNDMLEILHGDALEYFEPPEIVAAYEQEFERRIAAGVYCR